MSPNCDKAGKGEAVKYAFKRFMSAGVLAMMLAACNRPEPEVGIREAIASIEQALGARDNAGVREHLTKDFRGGPAEAANSLDQREAQRMLAGYFLRYRNIGVVVTAISVEPLPHDTDQAWSNATVLLTGAEGLIPETGRAYSVRGLWQFRDGGWRLAQLSWE